MLYYLVGSFGSIKRLKFNCRDGFCNVTEKCVCDMEECPCAEDEFEKDLCHDGCRNFEYREEE